MYKGKAAVRLGAGSGKARQGAQAKPAPGIGCLAKDGEIADCSKDPAVVKEAIKLIEKSPHPNAAVRLVQRSNGSKHRSRKCSRGQCTKQTSKLAQRVKDLERQLKLKSTRLAKAQLAIGKTKTNRKAKTKQTSKLAQRVKDLERQLEAKSTRLAKAQLAIGKTKKNRKAKKRNRKQSNDLNTCIVAKICEPIASGRSVKISKAALKAECLMH